MTGGVEDFGYQLGSATAWDDSGRFTIAPQTYIQRVLYEGNKADKTLPVPATACWPAICRPGVA